MSISSYAYGIFLLLCIAFAGTGAQDVSSTIIEQTTISTSSTSSSSLSLSASASLSSVASTLITITTSAQSTSPTTQSSSQSLRPSTSTDNEITSTLSSLASEAASGLPNDAIPDEPAGRMDDKTLAIIIGSCIGAIALLAMLAVFCCAFRHKRGASHSYTRTPSPLGSDRASKVMQSITSRKLFSSRSANAPEVLLRPDSESTKGRRCSLTALPTQRPDSSEIGLALGPIDESPQITPLSRSRRSSRRPGHRRVSGELYQSRRSLSGPRTSGDAQTSRDGLSRHQPRSVDMIDAASRRRQTSASPASRPSMSLSYHRKSSSSLRTPASPLFSPYSPLSPHASAPSLRREPNPFFKVSEDSLRSSDQLIAPLVPSRNPQRKSSPTVNRPSWHNTHDFEFDERDGQRGSRERPSMAMARRSSSWKPSRQELE